MPVKHLASFIGSRSQGYRTMSQGPPRCSGPPILRWTKVHQALEVSAILFTRKIAGPLQWDEAFPGGDAAPV